MRPGSRRRSTARSHESVVTGRDGSAPDPYRVREGLAVYRFGPGGEPILLLPGPHRFQQPGTRSADALIDGLTDLDREVITFDPPGAGHSTRAPTLTMSEMQGCATEALDVCSQQEPVATLGHSMGGLVALGYALERPALVDRLALVGTGSGGPAYMGAPGALWNRRHPAFPRLALLGILHLVLPCLATERLVTRFIDRRSFRDPRLVEPSPVRLRDWLRPARGRADWHRVARRLDYAPRLDGIGVPTLVICGRHDPQFPLSASRELAAGIPDARLVIFDRSGHHPFLEEPTDFWAVVDGFRRSPSGAGDPRAADGQ